MAKYPTDAQLPIGTTKQLFDSTYIFIDPQYIDGLGMWRVYPGIPKPEDITGLGAILPIVSTALSPTSVKVSFNIQALPDIRTSTATTALTSAQTLLGQPASSLPALSGQRQVQTIKPVRHIEALNKAILFFDITSLDRSKPKLGTRIGFVDVSNAKYKVVVKDYNNSNGVNIDSEAPMVDEVIGSTATFSFDITTLPKV